MRNLKTAAETLIDKIISDYLTTWGLDFVFDESITDKPDSVIVTNERRIGLEYVGLNLAEIYQYQIAQLELNTSKQLTYPVEPWFIFPKVIAKKNVKVGSYKDHALCDEIWLVIHDPIVNNQPQQYSDGVQAMVEEWFYFISERMQHDFGRILYIQFQEEETDQPITPKIHDFIVGEEWCVYLSIDVIDEIEVWAEVGTDFKTDILRNPTRKFESTRESKVKKKLQSWAEIIPYLEKMGVDIDELNFSP